MNKLPPTQTGGNGLIGGQPPRITKHRAVLVRIIRAINILHTNGSRWREVDPFVDVR